MSISGIINTGQSGLIAAQTQMAVTSTNITNAATDGYTAKTADTAATTVNGQVSGVRVTGIGTEIDKALQAEVMDATSTASHDATLAAYLDSVLGDLGTTEGGTALEATTTDLMLALNDAVAAGGDAASQADVDDALIGWSAALNDASASTQAARSATDDAIGEAVDDVNRLLHDLDALNGEIAQARAAGRSTADLLDAQRVALEELSAHLDITYYTASNGDLHVYSAGGAALLTSTAHELSYTPFGTMTADMAYDPAGGTVGAITIDGRDATAKLTGGEIGALVTLRDTELPAIQDQLDDLALGVVDAVNAAANTASPVPAPKTLTSDGVIDPDASFSAKGTVTVLETDSDGVVVGATDIDLGTLTSHQDLIDAFDAVDGLSAGLDAEGRLVLSADTDGHGLALADSGTVEADGRSLSHHLGFNNVLSGTGASNVAPADSLDDQGLPVATPASTTVGDVALEPGDTGGLQAMWTALDSPAGGDGSVTAKSAVAEVSTLIDGLADDAAAATDRAERSAATRESLSASFDNAHGVNVDAETAKLVTLEQSYETSAQILATAQDMFDSLISMMK